MQLGLAAKRALRKAIVEQRNYSIVFTPTSFLLRPGAPPPNAERADEGLEELRMRDGDMGEVTNFVLEDEEFTPENGMLTPSLKIKRRAIMEKLGGDIDDLYEGDDPLLGRDKTE